MMGSIFDKNLSALKNTHPQAYSKLHQNDKDYAINVIDAKDGNRVPEILLNNRRVYLHSKFNPIKEAERFIAEIDPEEFDLFIIIGFGFAFHVEELLKKIRINSTLLVLEKNPLVLKEAVNNRDLNALLLDERVQILIDPGEDEIATTLKGKSSYHVTFLTHRGSFQIDPEYYSNIKRIAMSYLSTKEVNIATLSKFEKTWSANIARNISAFKSFPGANIFYDRFGNIPAIVAAAGPSLIHSIEFIRSNQKKAIIVAVDTTYNILKRNGIEPHFCITVDPQIVNARYFEGDSRGKTILIADPTVHPSIFRLFKGNIALTGMAFQMMKWIEDITGENGELAYGGSVSTNAYDFAKRLGASPVVLIGQDLAFTDNLAHASGSYLDEEIRLKINRFYNANMFNRYQLNALPKIFVDSIRGEKIATNQKMMIFLSWFEKRDDSALINATYNGAYLKGVKHTPFNEIEFDNTTEDIPRMINEIYVSSDIKAEATGGGLLKRCAAMSDELESLLPSLERAVSLSDELISLTRKKKGDSKLDYILNKLSEVDKTIESRDTLKDMIGFTIQRVIHTITEGYEIDEKDESLTEDELVAKRSHYLYKGLLEGAQFNKKILKKMNAILSL